MIALLNASILTAFGAYSYEPCTLERARQLVADGFVSHIGHESTARLMSTLLCVEVPMDRTPYEQALGAVALVFKLRRRAPEGTILSLEQIEEIGYEWGVLTRIRRKTPREIIDRVTVRQMPGGWVTFLDHGTSNEYIVGVCDYADQAEWRARMIRRAMVFAAYPDMLSTEAAELGIDG